MAHTRGTEVQSVPHVVNPRWDQAFPWLVHGVTCREYDLRIRDHAPSGDVEERWEGLVRATGMKGVALARQVHGARVRIHGPDVEGATLVPDCDGHATGAPGILLAVTVADCVPVFLVAPDERVVALLHAGWRGVAAGILEEGVGTLTRELGAAPEGLRAWLGPAISGDEYEVGPEVHEALGLPVPHGPRLLDLRAVAAGRLAGGGGGGRVPGRIRHLCPQGSPVLLPPGGGPGAAGGLPRDPMGMSGLPLPGPLPAPDPGLCRSCRHAKVVRNRKGSAFQLCLRSKTDPGFPRYPNLPVLACPGYQPRLEA